MKNEKLKTFCIGLLTIGIISSCSTSQKSSVPTILAVMKVKEPIKGVCDNSYIIAILPVPGNEQFEPIAPKSDEEITAELNSKVKFLEDKPEYEDEGTVNLIVNCKGELVRCEIDNNTQSSELDSQIVAVFSELKIWKAGRIHNKSVDTSVLYNITIKNGKIVLS